MLTVIELGRVVRERKTLPIKVRNVNFRLILGYIVSLLI